MILGIDQYNNHYPLKDRKIKTVLEKTGYRTARPIFRDINKTPHKVGYYLSSRGELPLWIELFELKPAFNFRGSCAQNIS